MFLLFILGGGEYWRKILLVYSLFVFIGLLLMPCCLNQIRVCLSVLSGILVNLDVSVGVCYAVILLESSDYIFPNFLKQKSFFITGYSSIQWCFFKKSSTQSKDLMMSSHYDHCKQNRVVSQFWLVNIYLFLF